MTIELNGIKGTRRWLYGYVLSVLLSASTIPASAAEPPSVQTADRDADSGPHRWVSFLDLGADLRFNYMDAENGPVTDRGLQYRLHSRFRANLRKDGSTYVVVRAETGKAFDSSWNNTAYGLGKLQSSFNIKSVTLHQKIGERFALELGGLDFEQGAGSDATYASDDGYLTGYRARYDGSSHLLPVKLALTAAYVGAFDRQNFFSRVRMDRINYTQFLAEKEWGELFHASGEVDSMRKAVFVRAAARMNHLLIFDEPMVEAVVRTDGSVAPAWSVSLSRRWSPNSRWQTELAVVSLPGNFYEVNGQRFLLNREEFDTGKRLAVGIAYRLAHDLKFNIFAGRLLDRSNSKRWIAQMGFSYEFAGFINRFMR